jgi:hypothetical protein
VNKPSVREVEEVGECAVTEKAWNVEYFAESPPVALDVAGVFFCLLFVLFVFFVFFVPF